MSDFIERLEKYCKKFERPDLHGIFYTLFTDPDTTLEQIQEKIDYALSDETKALIALRN